MFHNGIIDDCCNACMSQTQHIVDYNVTITVELATLCSLKAVPLSCKCLITVLEGTLHLTQHHASDPNCFAGDACMHRSMLTVTVAVDVAEQSLLCYIMERCSALIFALLTQMRCNYKIFLNPACDACKSAVSCGACF